MILWLCSWCWCAPCSQTQGGRPQGVMWEQHLLVWAGAGSLLCLQTRMPAACSVSGAQPSPLLAPPP